MSYSSVVSIWSSAPTSSLDWFVLKAFSWRRTHLPLLELSGMKWMCLITEPSKVSHFGMFGIFALLERLGCFKTVLGVLPASYLTYPWTLYNFGTFEMKTRPRWRLHLWLLGLTQLVWVSSSTDPSTILVFTWFWTLAGQCPSTPVAT